LTSDDIQYRRTTIIISNGRKLYSYDFGQDAEEQKSTMTESDRAPRTNDNEENSTKS